MTTKPTFQLGIITRLGLIAGSAILIVGAALEMPVKSGSSEYKSYFEESSFAALSLRSQGGLKLGLGIAMLGLSAVGISTDELSNAFAKAPVNKEKKENENT